jgi:4-methyl-5(b-hydroxyethyl)-thiazole monophosphate biosynthesis
MKKVLLLLANGFEILEASAFIDVFGWSALEGAGGVDVHSCGLQNELKSSFNQRFIPDCTLDQISLSDYDALAIPGGFEEYGYYEDAFSAFFMEVIRVFNSTDKPIATVCVGALPLAKSGLFIGRKATTYPNPKRIDFLQDAGLITMDERIVADGNIITSNGPSTAVEVALLLLERLSSSENRDQVAKLMGFS